MVWLFARIIGARKFRLTLFQYGRRSRYGNRGVVSAGPASSWWPCHDGATSWVGIDRLGHRVEISACSGSSSVLIARDLQTPRRRLPLTGTRWVVRSSWEIAQAREGNSMIAPRARRRVITLRRLTICGPPIQITAKSTFDANRPPHSAIRHSPGPRGGTPGPLDSFSNSCAVRLRSSGLASPADGRKVAHVLGHG